jgi:hypothetical protein
MIHLVLADLVLVFHFAFIIFVTVGVVLVFRRPRLAWVHVPCVLWGTWIELRQGLCPLTPLENRFREWGGEVGYAGGFIDHYLGPVIYPSGLTHRTQMILGGALIVLNVGAYGLIAWRHRRGGAEKA